MLSRPAAGSKPSTSFLGEGKGITPASAKHRELSAEHTNADSQPTMTIMPTPVQSHQTPGWIRASQPPYAPPWPAVLGSLLPGFKLSPPPLQALQRPTQQAHSVVMQMPNANLDLYHLAGNIIRQRTLLNTGSRWHNNCGESGGDTENKVWTYATGTQMPQTLSFPRVRCKRWFPQPA